MEGEVKRPLSKLGRHLLVSFGVTLILVPGAVPLAQDKTPGARAEQAAISLRKSVNTKQYQGKEVEGEDRQIGPGDSLWRILVEEKGVPGKQFRSYVVIIRNLNPQVKNVDVLRVGDKIFIPLQPAQLLEGQTVTGAVAPARDRTGAGEITTNYQVQQGEHLYQILRDQLKITDERRLGQYFALVKDLNPERKDWDTLKAGDVVRLPTLGRGAEAQSTAPASGAEPQSKMTALAESKPAGGTQPDAEARAPTIVKPSAPSDPRQVLRAPARDNLALFAKVAEAMGSQMQQSGEEVVDMKDGAGAVRFDKRNFPVVFNPLLNQRVVVDPENKIPLELRNKLADPSVGTPILPLANGVPIQAAVTQLLAGLGYQVLPENRPIIVQEEGVTYEAKGDWMALAPEQSNKAQEILVISLVEKGAEIPEYLKVPLAKKGLYIKDLSLSSVDSPARSGDKNDSKEYLTQIKTWPRDKKEMVDSLLFSFGVPFGVAETLSVELQNGLRLEARSDRVFDFSGKRTALFFQRSDGEIRKALEEKQGLRTVELEVNRLSSRELITRLLSLLGDPITYREHRFSGANGSSSDRLVVTAWGFYVPKRSLFITDRQIPTALQRFFNEKGLEIVYFQ
jgi:hypothetical protein